jgi:hypothetical protein
LFPLYFRLVPLYFRDSIFFNALHWKTLKIFAEPVAPRLDRHREERERRGDPGSSDADLHLWIATPMLSHGLAMTDQPESKPPQDNDAEVHAALLTHRKEYTRKSRNPEEIVEFSGQRSGLRSPTRAVFCRVSESRLYDV